MTALATAARAVLGAPAIENSTGQIRLTVPLMNVGDTALAGLEVLSLTLGAAPRLSPPAGQAPIVLGLLGGGAVAHLAARFAGAGLTVGARYLLTLTARYTVGNVVYGMTLNRTVQVPAPALPAQPLLRARVLSSYLAGAIQYDIHNDEPPGSGLYISSLALTVSTPVVIASTPPGWQGETDGRSYVFWHAKDYLPPYPNHLMPGQRLSFGLTSQRSAVQASPALLSSWNHTTDAAGPVFADYVLTPYPA